MIAHNKVYEYLKEKKLYLNTIHQLWSYLHQQRLIVMFAFF